MSDSARPATRLRLTIHSLSRALLDIHQIVARYTLVMPDVERQIEAWQLGNEAVAHDAPLVFLHNHLGGLPTETPSAVDERQIQLWRGDRVLRAMLAEPFVLHASPPTSTARDAQTLSASLETPAHVCEGEIFYLILGWGHGKAIVAQASVHSVVARTSLVGTASPTHYPPFDPASGAVADSIDPLDAWRVWSDRLMDRDDPRGSLIAAHLSGQDATTLIETNSERLLGALADRYAPYTAIEWRLGYWHALAIRWSMTRARSGGLSPALMITEALSHDSGQILQTLSVSSSQRGVEATANWREVVRTLGTSKRRLRKLSLGDFSQTSTHELYGRCAVGPLWAALPDLEQLTLRCRDIDLGSPAGPKLHTLSLCASTLAGCVRQLGRGQLPALRRLHLHGDDAEDVPALLIGTAALRSLEILEISVFHMSSIRLGGLLDNAKHFGHLSEVRINRSLERRAFEIAQQSGLRFAPRREAE